MAGISAKKQIENANMTIRNLRSEIQEMNKSELLQKKSSKKSLILLILKFYIFFKSSLSFKMYLLFIKM